MFLSEATTSNFAGFDIFMIAFTVLIAIGLVRLLLATPKNKFAIGFAGIALAVFAFADFLMVLNWMHKL